MVETKTFSRGNAVDFLKEGMKQMDSSDRRGRTSYADPIEDTYGASISDNIGKLCRHIHMNNEPADAVTATARTIDGEHSTAEVLDLLDKMNRKLSDGLATRETGSEVTKKSGRDDVRVSEVLAAAGEEGTVFMAKSLSSMKKVKIAWNLHENNQVIVVNDYDEWAELLGWSKLKTLPHGRKKIRRELGDQLPQDVLDEVAPAEAQSRSSSSSSNSNKSTPTLSGKNEQLNVAKDSSHRMRKRVSAENLKESFEDTGSWWDVHRLVLFPSDTDRNMTDHWWVAGSFAGTNGEYSAIANCKQSTYNYLKDVDHIYHIDEYMELWKDYSITTEDGQQKYRHLYRDEPVIHFLKESLYNRFLRDGMLAGLSTIIAEFVDENVYKGPDIPQNATYCIADGIDEFYLRPALRDHSKDSAFNHVHVLETKATTHVYSSNISSVWGLYARGMLPDWDFNSTEMEKLESLSYNLKLDDGGYEIIQTLKKLHDGGEQPFSQTPQARWSQ